MLKRSFLFLLLAGSAAAQNTPPAGGGGGAAAIACAASPGNTTGSYRQQCQTAAGALYACNNSSGCTVAADWVAQGGSSLAQYTITFSGGGYSLPTGATRCLPIPGSGALQSVRLQACNGYDANYACNAVGSVTIDLRVATNASYASTGPSAASTIKSTGNLLTISSAYAADGVLTNWTTSGVGGKTVCAVLTSPTAMLVDVILGVQ